MQYYWLHTQPTGPKLSWSHLSFKFQEVATTEDLLDDDKLFDQAPSSAGFRADGSRTKSVTDSITRELEWARLQTLGLEVDDMLDWKDYEIFSWAACPWMCSDFLHAPLTNSDSAKTSCSR